MLVTIVVFILILSVLVLVHELGHFLVAKKLGVKVEEFGFGFPPRVYGKKVGETIYSINLLPIGGFVKLYGEDEAGGGKIQIKSKKSNLKNVNRTFFARPVWQRALIVVAGVVMNFLLASAIISYLFAVVGVQVPGHTVVISDVVRGAPAASAGLKPGDVFVSVNGKAVTVPGNVISIAQKNLGKQLDVVVKEKNGQTKEVFITPRRTFPSNQGPMGVAISASYTIVKYPWYQAPFVGTWEAVKESGLIVQGIGTTLVQVFVQKTVPAGVAGPVGIAELTGQFVKIGPDAVLSLVALLSLNLAVLNVLPVPALDGGRLFFILLEGITRRKMHSQFEAYVHNIGMIILLGLILLITLHDVMRLISGQPLLPKM